MNGNLLINRVLSEGIPDFISQLIVPYGNNGNYVTYGFNNEKKLKLKLKNELLNFGSGNWFGGADSLFIHFPRDLGYFMGSRIAESYFTTSLLINKKLTDLIEIKNLEKFIRESNYFNEL
ncbi:MAG: hypothetical protein IPP48_15375 [Chitinophagaceae bacterium]|nr:hypothetical protein [Chitinophagaceae bacterium]